MCSSNCESCSSKTCKTSTDATLKITTGIKSSQKHFCIANLKLPKVMQLLASPSLTSGTGFSRLDDQTEVRDVGQADRVRQPGGQFVRTADRLAVGVSQLTRPDSFHAGSCDSEREDWVRFRLFDVGVALVFEDSAQLARVCFSKPCWVSVPLPQSPSDLSNNWCWPFSSSPPVFFQPTKWPRHQVFPSCPSFSEIQEFSYSLGSRKVWLYFFCSISQEILGCRAGLDAEYIVWPLAHCSHWYSSSSCKIWCAAEMCECMRVEVVWGCMQPTLKTRCHPPRWVSVG